MDKSTTNQKVMIDKQEYYDLMTDHYCMEAFGDDLFAKIDVSEAEIDEYNQKCKILKEELGL